MRLGPSEFPPRRFSSLSYVLVRSETSTACHAEGSTTSPKRGQRHPVRRSCGFIRGILRMLTRAGSRSMEDKSAVGYQTQRIGIDGAFSALAPKLVAGRSRPSVRPGASSFLNAQPGNPVGQRNTLVAGNIRQELFPLERHLPHLPSKLSSRSESHLALQPTVWTDW